MTTESAILNKVKHLPEPMKQAVLLYTEFLASRYVKENLDANEEADQRSSLAGALQGTFMLPLADDFDQPIEDFEEYM